MVCPPWLAEGHERHEAPGIKNESLYVAACRGIISAGALSHRSGAVDTRRKLPKVIQTHVLLVPSLNDNIPPAMRYFCEAAAVLALGLLGTGHALKATILADTNRDGKVDVAGDTDIAGKCPWTDQRGALFLANIGDTDQRCSVHINDSTADGEIDKCHDASDNVQRNPKYLAPLRTVPVSELSNVATGSISVSGAGAAERVRIFRKQDDGWVHVDSNYTFPARDLKAGLDLGIDARDVRRPGVWDGRVTVQFSIRDGEQTANDSVALRVAPVLTHHHLQLASQVLVVGSRARDPQSKFVQDLRANVKKAGITKPVFQLDPVFQFYGDDIWAQDFFEPGYTSIPGPEGPIMLRVMIRSTQSDRRAGRQVFSKLRSDTVGAVQYLKEGYGATMESTGNLETIPPHTHNGKSYPAGRTVMGSIDGTRPYMVNFLNAQEVQATVEIDTTWLMVGHVDEFMQFLPAENPRGWVMVVCDPIAGLEILKKAKAAGLGSTKALSRPSFPTDVAAERGGCLPGDTIDDVLNRGNLTSNFTSIQTYTAEKIRMNINIIKRETGIGDDEVIRVPALFYTADLDCPRNKSKTANADLGNKDIIVQAGGSNGRAKMMRRRKRGTETVEVSAFYPGTVNGVVLSNTQVLAPNPWGPVVNGKDIIAEAVSEAYRRVNYTVVYQDDWFSHHTEGGEVHCGTNTIRDPSTPWW
ncbi:Protein-arginine deiminase type-1 [Tolypocladium paradoxum]|uniref:Protein-arginine deiminase type-1 n=1 Tax=Tolypocladium paradoxum TaxID=94208 RepID=A0A2S4L1M4_9HYPO|nr:Protein-arginine deiminase type-1 [Tolypocladium paradoxum]